MEQVVDFIGVFGIVLIGVVLIIIGYIGSVMPALPGPPIALGSIFLIHFTLFKYPIWILAVLTILTIIMALADYYVPILGTKKFGGSKAGVKGSTLGLIFGVLITFFTSGFGIIFLLAGPFVGAFLGEKYAKNDNTMALKSAIGSLIGFLAGAVGKVIVVSIILIMFIWKVIPNIF